MHGPNASGWLAPASRKRRMPAAGVRCREPPNRRAQTSQHIYISRSLRAAGSGSCRAVPGAPLPLETPKSWGWARPGFFLGAVATPCPVLTMGTPEEKNSFSRAVRTHGASSDFVPRCPVTTKPASPCYPASPHKLPPSHPLTRLRSRPRRLLRRALHDGDVPAHRASSS